MRQSVHRALCRAAQRPPSIGPSPRTPAGKGEGLTSSRHSAGHQRWLPGSHLHPSGAWCHSEQERNSSFHWGVQGRHFPTGQALEEEVGEQSRLPGQCRLLAGGDEVRTGTKHREAKGRRAMSTKPKERVCCTRLAPGRKRELSLPKEEGAHFLGLICADT